MKKKSEILEISLKYEKISNFLDSGLLNTRKKNNLTSVNKDFNLKNPFSTSKMHGFLKRFLKTFFDVSLKCA